jgi:uncharacterized protein with FMN-binding domain
MKRILRPRAALALASGLSLAAVLAGCASTTSEGQSSGSSADSSSTSSSTGVNATSTSDNTTSYKDGTYSADGSYVSPDGAEEIAVTVTVKSNLITAVTVKTIKADGEGAQYQSQFEGGISAVAVGKSLATLSVGTVAGSSLTSQGFDSALATIRSEAAA